MTTDTPHRVRITEIPSVFDSAESREALRRGLSEASLEIEPAEMNRLYDEMPARFTEPVAITAWSALIDDAIAEISPEVRELLVAAIRRRLPFEWEGPELYR